MLNNNVYSLLFYFFVFLYNVANKLKPQEIFELLDGYTPELDTLDSDDEQFPIELQKMNEDGKYNTAYFNSK